MTQVLSLSFLMRSMSSIQSIVNIQISNVSLHSSIYENNYISLNTLGKNKFRDS